MYVWIFEFLKLFFYYIIAFWRPARALTQRLVDLVPRHTFGSRAFTHTIKLTAAAQTARDYAPPSWCEPNQTTRLPDLGVSSSARRGFRKSAARRLISGIRGPRSPRGTRGGPTRLRVQVHCSADLMISAVQSLRRWIRIAGTWLWGPSEYTTRTLIAL